jgi:nucleoid DNA-binding protein
MTKAQYNHFKKEWIAEITQKLKTDGRIIIRGLGTLKVVRHKAKQTNLGEIPARNLVKLRTAVELNEAVSKTKVW